MTDSQKGNGLLQNFHSPISHPGRFWNAFEWNFTKKRKERNLEPGNETVTQSKQKLDLYSFALPGLTDFRLLNRKGLKMSKRTPTCQRKTANTPEEENKSLLVTCAYGRRLIFPVGSHSTVWTHPFWEQFVFLSNFKWDIWWDISSQLWQWQIQSIKPSTTNEEACLHGEGKDHHSQGGLGVTAGSFTGG